jgi:hypothetical protein
MCSYCLAQLQALLSSALTHEHSHLTANEKSLIEGLLQIDLTRRLGCMHNGVRDITDHPLFQGSVVS